MGVFLVCEYLLRQVHPRWFHDWFLMLQRALTAIDDLDCLP